MTAGLSWERRDRHRVLTVGGVVGLALAIVMAIWGLPPIDLHGPLHRIGIMDPFCGGTRAAYFTMRGDWDRAWTYNPLGILAVAAALLVTMRLITGWLTRRWATVTIRWTPRGRTVAVTLGIVLLAVLEVRQQLRADLLTQSIWMP